MPSVSELDMQKIPLYVKEVGAGNTVVFNCTSNDNNHNFEFWELIKNKIIGPGNGYDEQKFKYEVLSGRLHIKSVSPAETGFYKCFSRSLDGSGLDISTVEMIVKGGDKQAYTMGPIHEADSTMDAIKLVAIVISIIVITTCIVVYWRLRKEWSKYDGRSVVPDDGDEEDEQEVEEVYNRTTTTLGTPVPGPSRNTSSDHLFGIDNQGLDTDFNSVFEQIQIKSPPRSLI